MKKYELTGQTIRVESSDDDCIVQKATLRRIKDNLVVDAESPALFLTPNGIQLLWPRDESYPARGTV